MTSAVTAKEAMTAWPETYARLRAACGDQTLYRGKKVDLDQIAADVALVVARAKGTNGQVAA